MAFESLTDRLAGVFKSQRHFAANRFHGSDGQRRGFLNGRGFFFASNKHRRHQRGAKNVFYGNFHCKLSIQLNDFAVS